MRASDFEFVGRVPFVVQQHHEVAVLVFECVQLVAGLLVLRFPVLREVGRVSAHRLASRCCRARCPLGCCRRAAFRTPRVHERFFGAVLLRPCRDGLGVELVQLVERGLQRLRLPVLHQISDLGAKHVANRLNVSRFLAQVVDFFLLDVDDERKIVVGFHFFRILVVEFVRPNHRATFRANRPQRYRRRLGRNHGEARRGALHSKSRSRLERAHRGEGRGVPHSD